MSEHAANSPTTGVSARNAGFAFVARTNRWMIAGAVAIAGGLTAVTAHAFHARPSAAARPKAAASTPTSRGQSSGSQSAGAQLQPPSQPPAAADPNPVPTPVVSGGS